jgi:hypothetical protein
VTGEAFHRLLMCASRIRRARLLSLLGGPKEHLGILDEARCFVLGHVVLHPLTYRECSGDLSKDVRAVLHDLPSSG